MSNQHYRQTQYLLSAYDLSQMPADTGAEVAFVGRSNAGKSSVINAITEKRGLARTSKTPGRTQLINFFSVTGDVRLADLPGYGFARAPKAMQAHWGEMMRRYLETRQSLQALLLITDIRRLLNDVDEQMLAWCDAVELPVHVILNKSDKLSFGAASQALLRMQHSLSEPSSGCKHQVQLFSALKKSGLDELCGVLDGWLFPTEQAIKIGQ